MVWRNWSVIVILILVNYLVFSMLATLVFPPAPLALPAHAVQVTFTPGVLELQNVGTLTYIFPTATASPTLTATVTITPTGPARTPPPTGPAKTSP